MTDDIYDGLLIKGTANLGFAQSVLVRSFTLDLMLAKEYDVEKRGIMIPIVGLFGPCFQYGFIDGVIEILRLL
jgi:hypothetical protein